MKLRSFLKFFCKSTLIFSFLIFAPRTLHAQSCADVFETLSADKKFSKFERDQDRTLRYALYLESRFAKMKAAQLQTVGSRRASQMLLWFRARVSNAIIDMKIAKNKAELDSVFRDFKEIDSDFYGLSVSEATLRVVEEKFDAYQLKHATKYPDFQAEWFLERRVSPAISVYLSETLPGFESSLVYSRFAEVEKYFSDIGSGNAKNDSLIAVLVTHSFLANKTGRSVAQIFMTEYLKLQRRGFVDGPLLRKTLDKMSPVMGWNPEAIYKSYFELYGKAWEYQPSMSGMVP